MGKTNLKWDCAGTYYSVQPENSVIRVQGSLNLTFAHTGKLGQILCYTCEVVRMVHEQHYAGTYCSVQPENSVIRMQGSLNLTFAHTGKFGQILCYTCDVVRMVHG